MYFFRKGGERRRRRKHQFKSKRTVRKKDNFVFFSKFVLESVLESMI